MSDFEDDDILSGFIQECREHLSTIENDLLLIEDPDAPDRRDRVNTVFRAAHSIKGGAGFLGLTQIQELAHKTENVLDRIRSEEIAPSPEVINVLLQAFDRLNELIENHAASNDADVSDLCLALTGLLSSYLPEHEKASLNESVEVSSKDGDWRISVNAYDLAQSARQGYFVYLVRVDLIHDVQAVGRKPYDLIKEINSAGSILASRVNIAAVGTLDDSPASVLPMELLYASIVDPEFVDGLFEGVPKDNIHLVSDPRNPDAVHQPPAPPEPPAPPPSSDDDPIAAEAATASADSTALDTTDDASLDATDAAASSSKGRLTRHPKAAASGTQSAKVEDTLRVSVTLLESLMNLAGELVLARNQLLEAQRQKDERLSEAATHRINLVSSELQEAIMQTRMQPIGTVLSKLPRLVRDLSQKAAKRIQLDISGAEVEMDKAIVEGIGDPLTHMIRNSADHGIEPPAERSAAGKPEEGCISLSARHEAGQVLIEIADDGRGMDPERIAESAVAKGKLSAEEAARLSPVEKLNLIFLPGLSTAKTITDVSGRGVGMDVVKTNIDRLGGQIQIESKPGVGSLFRIHLPLTLAIIPSLIVTAKSQRFAIPQPNVRELIRVAHADRASRIKRIGQHHTITVRKQLLPLVYLPTLTHGNACPLPEEGTLNLVILRSAESTFALCVDALHDTEEIVIRPLGIHLKECIEFSGATILGNGSVAMILDAAGIATKANLAKLEQATQQHAQLDDSAASQTQTLQLLTFFNNPKEPCAVHLNDVRRIERVDASQIDQLGGIRSMHYRDAQLPLFALADFARFDPIAEESDLIVLVIEPKHAQPFGILGRLPIDVAEIPDKLDTKHTQHGIIGSCRVNDRTTLVIDLNAVFSTPQQAPALTDSPRAHALEAPPPNPTANPAYHILLAEDSSFFRQQLVQLLSHNGFAVDAFPDGQAALNALLANPNKFDLLLTDIEMPNLDGLGLVRAVRANPAVKHIPIVAVTTLADAEDVQRGLDAGVTEYQIKLDKEELLLALHRILPTPEAV